MGLPQRHRSCQEPSPVWIPHKITASFEHPSASEWGAAQTAGKSLIHCEPSWVAVGQLLHHGLACRGFQTLSTSSLFFFTDLNVSEFLLSLSHSSQWLLFFCISFRVLNYVYPRGLPPSLRCSAFASSMPILMIDGIGSVARWNFMAVSHRSYSCRHPCLLTNTWPYKPNKGVRVMGYFSFWFCFSPS